VLHCNICRGAIGLYTYPCSLKYQQTRITRERTTLIAKIGLVFLGLAYHETRLSKAKLKVRCLTLELTAAQVCDWTRWD
jgi:hypothetical protein